jgi:hypothetical protein
VNLWLCGAESPRIEDRDLGRRPQTGWCNYRAGFAESYGLHMDTDFLAESKLASFDMRASDIADWGAYRTTHRTRSVRYESEVGPVVNWSIVACYASRSRIEWLAKAERM